MRKNLFDLLIEWLINRHDCLKYSYEEREMKTAAMIVGRVPDHHESSNARMTWFLTYNEIGDFGHSYHCNMVMPSVDRLHQTEEYIQIVQPWCRGMMGAAQLKKLYDEYPDRVSIPGMEIKLTPIKIPDPVPAAIAPPVTPFWVEDHKLHARFNDQVYTTDCGATWTVATGKTHMTPVQGWNRNYTLQPGESVPFLGSNRQKYMCFNTGNRKLLVRINKLGELENVQFVSTALGKSTKIPWNGKDYCTNLVSQSKKVA
jgi:hypothetical protein